MKKVIYLSLAATLFISLAGCAQDGMQPQGSMNDGMAMKEGKGMKTEMKMMDTNGDGMISKDEFIKHHEMMYDKMKKSSNGMVSVKDMQMMMDEMMK